MAKVANSAGAAVAQDGAPVVRAVPAAVLSPDPSSGATTGGLVALTFRNRPALPGGPFPAPYPPPRRYAWGRPYAPGSGTRGGPTAAWC